MKKPPIEECSCANIKTSTLSRAEENLSNAIGHGTFQYTLNFHTNRCDEGRRRPILERSEDDE